jgi:hypothetical protein
MGSVYPAGMLVEADPFRREVSEASFGGVRIPLSFRGDHQGKDNLLLFSKESKGNAFAIPRQSRGLLKTFGRSKRL